MIHHYFFFDGISSRDYGIYLSGPGTTDAPQRDISALSIPGRSGDLMIDNGRYLNQAMKYHCAIIHGFEPRFSALKQMLLSRVGYCRLEDTIHPDEFRLASFAGPIRPRTTPYNRAGEFDLEFNCKPQRYLRSGEHEINLTASSSSIFNPGLPSLPLITVSGNGAGTVTVGGTTVDFKPAFSGPLTLDCETQNAYYNGQNKNSEVSAPVFPSIPSGTSLVTWTGGIRSVSIIPRWWIV